MPIPPIPPPLPNFFKSRPSSLKLPRKNSSCCSTSASDSLFTFSSTSPCTTPELKDFLAQFHIDMIEKLITNNTEKPLKNGHNGVVKAVTLFIQDKKGKSRTLVKKQGSFGVERENKMTKAIQNITANDFPFEFFALPLVQGSNGTSNILYTSFQEIGDLQTHVDYIYNQYNTNPSAVLSYLFQGFHQLLESINALESSIFKDENEKFHQGIIHNDIKPSNIFLKTNGNLILGDFGCAYFKDEVASQIGTFQFSAPELFINKDFCIKSLAMLNTDLWSVGACLWYLLTNHLLSPILPTEPLSDTEKIFFYRGWAENYSTQWQTLIEDLLNLTGEQLVTQIINTIDADLENLRINSNNSQNTEHKKKILNKLGLLMQAPISERPKVNELKDLMTRLEDYFVIYGEAEEFAAQLLERKKNQNPAELELHSNKLILSR